ncbi:MAG: YraN family protein [Pirellulales bacterium]|nr:YraN family protein [Pirellulales bacterium]
MSIYSKLRSWLKPTRPNEGRLGDRGEILAARHLAQLGFRILERGHDSRYGEIDLIALDGQTTVFIEVKTRSNPNHGHPAYAIDAKKRSRLTQAALAYLKSHSLLERPARFDVVSVIWPTDNQNPTIEHFPNAFEPPGSGQFFA